MEATISTALQANSWPTRAASFVKHRRVAISIILFGGLVLEDLISGVVPRDIFALRDPTVIVGLLCVLGGLAIRTWAAGFLVKNSELTTTGPYAFVRNPLYLGSFLMAAGFCLLIDDPENIWVIPAILLVLYIPKVRCEERGLAGRFPEQWQAYSKRTPRFLPFSLNRPRVAGWRLAQWRRSREYQAVFATAAGLTGLQIVRMLHV